MYSDLESASKKRYINLLKMLIPTASGLMIIDHNNQPMWSIGDPLSIDLALALVSTTTNSTDNKANPTIMPVNSGYFIFHDLINHNLECELHLLISFKTTIPAHQKKAFFDATKLIGNYISHEFEMNNELNSLARELGERYDELNLVYDTADEASHIVESNESLQLLIQSCTKYLDVSFAALLLPEKNIEIFQIIPKNTPIDATKIIDIATNKIYPWMQYEKRSMVINETSDSLRTDDFPEIRNKIICCPIMVEKEECCGILLVLNATSNHNFTNSDRNLLDVMSRKAGKIIQSNYDRQTGLLNRTSFDHQLEQSMLNNSIQASQQCLLHIDIDQMQIINDTATIEAGNELIKLVSNTLRKTLKDTDIIARIGGNTFTVLLDHCNMDQSLRIANKLNKHTRALHFTWQGQRLASTISIGLVPLSAADNAQHLMTIAEMACDCAKQRGRDQTQVYEKESKDLLRREEAMLWVTRIQNALYENRFCLYAQPIVVTSSDRTIHHYEILLRMIDTNGDLIAPGFFLPAAEHYRLMPSIDRWVLNNTLNLLGENWPSLAATGIKWAINLSGQSFDSKDFLSFCLKVLMRSVVPASMISFEITETAAFCNMNATKSFIAALKAQGCEFSLDDFGTGLSSFDYLKSLPLEYLKIDGKFIRDILVDPVSEAMVRAISEIGAVMGLKTIAEFVESEEIMQRLQSLGVNFGQGYALGKPLPLTHVIEQLLDDRKQLISGAR